MFVHPQALVETEEIGARTRVWAFAHLMRDSRVGSDCVIGDHCFVESGAVVGDSVMIKNGVQIYDKVVVENDVFLGPNVVFTNDPNPRSAFKKPPDQFQPTLVRRGATIGANATIVCGVTIGEQAFVGAGSVVINDVPPHSVVVGNPARPIGFMCTCGERLPESLSCSCGRAYEEDDRRGGLRQKEA